LPGVSAPPPFGGNQKTVIIKVNPDKIRDYHLTADEIVQSLAKANVISPAGNLRIGDETMITNQNSVVENIRELENMTIKQADGISVYVRDVAEVMMGADVTTSYALINGKRSVYIPVTKRSNASTWDVVKRVKAALPEMQAAVPEDIKVSYEFDQSGYVINALKSLIFEGLLGAILTGLMVLLFLRDRRSSLIVVLTIPLSILSSVIFLNAFGQTINIMTLGGLALAIGILVDEATVTIENIHHHVELGKKKPRAILDASLEIAFPKLLILLCILAVFVPAFFMSGIPASMFYPMSLAVGLAMISSFILSQTFVPVAANWFLKENPKTSSNPKFEKFKSAYKNWISRFADRFKSYTYASLLITLIFIAALFRINGTEIFPKVDAGQAQLRLRMPTGTRLERTEEATQKILGLTDSITHGNVEISSAFVGTQPSSYPVGLIHLWTSGPNEAVIKINLKKDAVIPIEDFKEELRRTVALTMPGVKISFEPGDITEQVLNMGSTNPIEIAVLGKNLAQSRVIAEKLNQKLLSINCLRDVQIATPLDYPSMKIDIDRIKAGQFGLSVDQISKSTVAATSSSRFTQPNYWLDKTTGTAYQVQVEYPQYKMNSPEELEMIPVAGNTANPIYLRDVASWKKTTSVGEYDRINQQRFITITANIHNKDLGTTLQEVNEAIGSLGELPKGMKINVRGQAELLDQTMNELQTGLIIAIVVIFLLLTISFQSFRLSLITLSIVPIVILGSFLLLFLTRQTLNIQSYMGIIMAVGVAVSNAILFITNAQKYRIQNDQQAFLHGAVNRLRPILMTTFAMIAGMIPMALGIGRAGDQSAPLGIAVIGGLLFSAVSTLIFLPLLYAQASSKKRYQHPSFDPEDKNSRYYKAIN